MLTDFEDHLPTIGSIPPVGTSLRNKFLTTKRDGSIPAITGLGEDSDAINEHALHMPHFWEGEN